MDFIDLLLPIFLSAVFVFLASSVLHMLIPIHRNDCKRLPDEEGVLEAMRKDGAMPPPGEYMFPHCADMKEMVGPEMTAKYDRGPVGFMIVRDSGTPTMGKPLLQWFLYCIGVSLLCGGIGYYALAPGLDDIVTLQVFGIASFGMYGFSSAVNSIWKSVPWSTTIKFVFDGLIYAAVTAATFTWLWPDSWG